MKTSKLLELTQGGLQIYAYILRQYYPSETLYCQENQCRLARNPFNENKRTLSVSVKDGIAYHRDVERPEFKGDAFDFAGLHYKAATFEEVYRLLNKGMKLGIRPAVEDELEWLEGKDDTWFPRISFFKPPISNVLPTKHLSLRDIHELITGDSYADITTELRSIKDPRKRQKFKGTRFHYVTFAGSFRKRKDDMLLHPSHLLVLDFDHLEYLEEVKQALLVDKYIDTELLFTSPSGDGLKWVIRREEGSIHQEYFRAVANYLDRTYGLQADESGKDVSRACYLPKDSQCHIHPRHLGVGELDVTE